MSKKGLDLHWKILSGLLLGLLWGVSTSFTGLDQWTEAWIAPIGDLFVRMLKLIAIPLVITSLVLGVSSTESQAGLTKLGFRTIGFYLLTTALAIGIGLGVANGLQPGRTLSAEFRQQVSDSHRGDSNLQLPTETTGMDRSWMQFMADLVPENIVTALGDNGAMLQVVFLALVAGLGLARLNPESSNPLRELLSAAQSLLTLLIDWIMAIAPYGVFALMASVLSEMSGQGGGIWELLAGLGWYAGTVAIAMLIHLFLVYGVLYRTLVKRSFLRMIEIIRPALLLGFSTSSSLATLPVTMDRVENGLGISPAVSRFVLPVGTTVNMDGTSIYQAVSALFIAQVLGMELTWMQQGTLLFTALLASIGSAGVPGAGVVMLVVVLESIQVPVEGIALILGLERILDMMRTALNVAGDAVVASLVAATEGVESDVVPSHDA